MVKTRGFGKVKTKSRYEGTKMFNIVTRTWNPVVGCSHLCTFCWCRRFAETRLRHIPYYKDFTNPKLVPKRFNEVFKPGEFVFVVDMGDLFCEVVPSKWIEMVINHVKKFSETTFLFLTKNPRRYLEFINDFPSNAVLGVTIETNRDDLVKYFTKAPLPSWRFEAMISVKVVRPELRRFLSIEPIFDFDLDIFTKWVIELEPWLIYIGYDNYNNHLPEPHLDKVRKFIEILKDHGFTVLEKTIRKAWWEGKYVNPVFIDNEMCIQQDEEGRFWYCCEYNEAERDYTFMRKILYCSKGVKKKEDLDECYIENI